MKHNRVIFSLYLYISEVGKAPVFPVLQKRNLTPLPPKKQQQTPVSLFTVIVLGLRSPNLSLVFPVAQVVFYNEQERNH